MNPTISREQILSILYDLASTINGAVGSKSLAERVLQRILYHTGLPVGMIVSRVTPLDSQRVFVHLDTSLGDHRLRHEEGSAIPLAAVLLPPEGTILSMVPPFAEGLAALHTTTPMTVGLSLPIPHHEGHMLLLGHGEGCEKTLTELPLAGILSPILAQFGAAFAHYREWEQDVATHQKILLEAIELGGTSVSVATTDGEIQYANALFLRQSERADSPQGQSITQWWPEWSDEALRPQVESALGHRRNWEGEVSRHRSSGDILWEDVTIVPIHGDHRKISRWVRVARDITDDKRQQQKLRQTVERLRKANYHLERFAYVTSHDLHEPLRAIASYAQLLQRHQRDLGTLDEASADFVTTIIGASKQLHTLMGGLADYAHLMLRPQDMELVNLKNIWERSLRVLAHAIRTSQAKLMLRGSLPTVWGSSRQLSLLFEHLLANCLKFQPVGQVPMIEVWSVPDGPESCTIHIKDNGIGIEDTDQNVFDIFRRLHGRDSYAGSGVGLALCQRVVQNHGGEIRYANNPGGGVTFSFSLLVQPPMETS